MCVCVLKYIWQTAGENGKKWEKYCQIMHKRGIMRERKNRFWRSGGLTCVSVMRVKPVAFNVYRREMRRKTWRSSERASERVSDVYFFSSTSVDLVFETSIAFSEESLMQTSSLWPVYDERKRERLYANSRNACISFERKDSGWKYNKFACSKFPTRNFSRESINSLNSRLSIRNCIGISKLLTINRPSPGLSSRTVRLSRCQLNELSEKLMGAKR